MVLLSIGRFSGVLKFISLSSLSPEENRWLEQSTRPQGNDCLEGETFRARSDSHGMAVTTLLSCSVVSHAFRIRSAIPRLDTHRPGSVTILCDVKDKDINEEHVAASKASRNRYQR